MSYLSAIPYGSFKPNIPIGTTRVICRLQEMYSTFCYAISHGKCHPHFTGIIYKRSIVLFTHYRKNTVFLVVRILLSYLPGQTETKDSEHQLDNLAIEGGSKHFLNQSPASRTF